MERRANRSRDICTDHGTDGQIKGWMDRWSKFEKQLIDLVNSLSRREESSYSRSILEISSIQLINIRTPTHVYSS